MRSVTGWLVVLIALAMCPGIARAEYIAWKYSWSRSPEIVYADDPAKGHITLSEEPLREAEGSTDIVATNLKLYTEATSQHPATWTNKPYTLTLHLLDEDSGQTGTLSFDGRFNGTASKKRADIDNEFVGDTVKDIQLGNNLYTVSISSYVPPGPPSQGNQGAIGAYADVTVRTIQKAPEPSSLVLAGTGLSVLAGAWWRRRRQPAHCGTRG